MNNSRIIVLVLAVTLAAAAVTAHAGVRASATSAGFYSYDRAPQFVPLNEAGATTLSFKLPTAGKKVLTYSAECAVNSFAGNHYAWLDLDVYVNGNVVAATQAGTDAFCSANGFPGFDSYVRASITLVIQGKKGSNTVRIQARPSFDATGIWLQDSALVIHD